MPEIIAFAMPKMPPHIAMKLNNLANSSARKIAQSDRFQRGTVRFRTVSAPRLKL
jgi:hypothetical protein